MPSQLIWLIFLLPVFSFVIISFLVRPFVKPESRVAGYITITALTGSLVLSLWALTKVMADADRVLEMTPIPWMVVGDLNIHLGLMVDSLTAVMLVVVTVGETRAITATMPGCRYLPPRCWVW